MKRVKRRKVRTSTKATTPENNPLYTLARADVTAHLVNEFAQ